MIEQVNTLGRAWWDWMWPMFWQVGALILVIGAIDVLLRKRLWPQIRYGLWFLVIVKLILPPTLALPTGIVSHVRPLVAAAWQGLGFERQMPASLAFGERLDPGRAGEEMNSPSVAAVESAASTGEPTHPVIPTMTDAVRTLPMHLRFSWQSVLMTFWLAGTFAVGLWSILRFRRVCRIAREQTAELPASLAQGLADAAEKLHLRRLPRVVASDAVGSPAVIGPVRPALLIPQHGIDHLSPSEAEHVFLHELAHIKRGDLKVQAICILIQIFYWFNPFVWFVQRRLQHLREICCDATVARVLKGDVAEYRRTILETAYQVLAKPRDYGVGLLGLVETRSHLLSRLSWLERMPWRHYRLRVAVTAVALALTGTCVLPMAQARDATADVSAEAGDAQPSGTHDQEASLMIRISDFGRWIHQVREIVSGEIAEIVLVSRDDQNVPVIVVQFEGAIDKPLLFHLEARDDSTWCADYFYIGSADIVTLRPIPSHAECPVERHFVVPRLRTADGSGDTLADSDPVEAVRKQVDHLRAILKHRHTGAYSLSPPGEVMCGFVELGTGEEASYLAFHLARQGLEHRVDCMEITDSISGCAWTPPASQRPESSSRPTEPQAPEPIEYTIPEANLQIPEEWQPCAERLQAIYAAVKEYEGDHGGMPTWLSDLVPGYLTADDLVWPEDGPQTAYRTPDPQLPCSFGYQYSSAAPGPGGKTCRQWKDEQRAICGDAVPLVRYYGANQRCLNLSFDGRIYVSNLVWERDLDRGRTRLYESALARPAAPALPQERLSQRWEEIAANEDLVPVFRGEYLHRSRGHDYLRAVVEKHIDRDGAAYYLSRMGDIDNLLITDGKSRPVKYAYRRDSRDTFGRYLFGRDQFLWERKMPQREDVERFNWKVREGALPDLNSRPDPYLIQHVLLQSYDQQTGGRQTLTVYDIDSEGTGVNEYEIALTLVDEDGVTLPNGRFKAKHFVQVQQTASNTWYKKGPGSQTEYWMDDDFNILRIYRHREPYEVILENYAGVLLSGPVSPAPPLGPFEVPEANRQIPEVLMPCAGNLLVIYAALKAYEADQGRMPDWLCELVPDYLEDEVLHCPADPTHTTSYWRDPELPCSYCYELNPSELRGAPPLDKTMRDYKLAQRRLFGDVVPIVRCFHHGTALNLAWNGVVYTSPVAYERLFIPDYHHGMLPPGEPPE